MANDVESMAQAANVVHAIGRAGGQLTREMLDQVIENPGLAAAINHLIRNHGVESIFPTPEQQLDNVRAWAGNRIFMFSIGYFELVQSWIPRLPPPTLDPLQATFLVPWFGLYADNIEMLWKAILRAHPSADSEYGAHLEHVEGTDDPTSISSPSLQWVQIQFDTNLGRPLVREPGTGLPTRVLADQVAGIHLLAAAAHAPAWASHLGEQGGRFNRVALSGCRWRDQHGRHSVPLLSSSVGGRLHLLKCTAIHGESERIAQPTIKVLGP